MVNRHCVKIGVPLIVTAIVKFVALSLPPPPFPQRYAVASETLQRLLRFDSSLALTEEDKVLTSF